jgi:hypothetical protein
MGFWLDYTVEQGLNRFRVTGDWDREVMGFDKDGNKTQTKGTLYNAGEVYMVHEDGWLYKIDDLSALILKHGAKKKATSK